MKDSENKKGHAFSIILIMVVLMLVGAACIPLLNIQYEPVRENRSLIVAFVSPGSARVVESDVTQIIEGALNTLKGVENIRAISGQGGGYITIDFKKGTDMVTTRFDISTRLRQIRSKLPPDTYMEVSATGSSDITGRIQLLRYTINAPMPAIDIVQYANDHLVAPLSRIEGVESVSTSGASPFEWVISFDPNSLRAAGLGPDDLSAALGRYFKNSIVGTQVLGNRLMLVRLKTRDLTGNLEQVPICKVAGRMYYMADFATIRHCEQPPSSYSRINGLNTITLYVEAMEGINTITVCSAVKERMEELKESLPQDYAVRLSFDASEYLNTEIHKIFLRALISLAILLLFVLVVSRSLRYLLVIGLTILVNLLSAVIFYNLFGVDIELYSMAGITVSLGIIIDTAIVIADHYTYYGNRKVMFSITGALLTTIAALLLVFFLPIQSRANLTDFIWVIVINLTLSIVVAFLFVPALLQQFPLNRRGVVKNNMRSYRRLVRRRERYERITLWGRSHRWVYVVGLLFLFGIPIQLLPSSVRHKDVEDEEEALKGGLVGLYNKTIGSQWYQHRKMLFEFPIGGSFNLFQKFNSGRMSLDRDKAPHDIVLTVQMEVAEGQNVQQLNNIVKEMENWLQQFTQIREFVTMLQGTKGTIEIHFKDEFKKDGFPYELKQMLWAKAIRYGGATWYIPALSESDQPLSNAMYRTSWTYTMQLYGYNYDILYRYAQDLIDSLKTNRRVNNQAGFASGWNSYVANEFYMDFDREKIVRSGTNLYSYLYYLREQLYDNVAGRVYDGESYVSVRLTSQEHDYYDLWHIRNDMANIDSVGVRLNELGSISKRRTGLNIERENQEYKITVGYEFTGSWDLRYFMQLEQLERLERDLPMGFRVGGDSSFDYARQQKQRTILILVVVLVIFMICASMFESFKISLVIVLLIPVSFIGMFLSYPILGIPFGQGGFAAMVMLCGITVNAGIYLSSEYRTIAQSARCSGLRCYIKAYNRKIVPTMLTILSTALGLVPFLFDGRDNQFWFSFAVGVMSGMLFSIIALVLFMPAFFPFSEREQPEAAPFS